MIAIPIRPGLVYRVRGLGEEFNVLACHGAEAICIALNLLLEI